MLLYVSGVLARCLESLEEYDRHSADHVRTSLALREVNNTLQILNRCDEICKVAGPLTSEASTQVNAS